MEYDEGDVRKLTVSDTMTLSPRGMFERMHVLLAEIDRLRSEQEKHPGVWDDAPDNAIIAKVHFYKADKVYARTDGIPTVYTRTLPKTKAREIAERKAREWANGSKSSAYVDGLSEHIESAINEAMEGGK